MQQGTSHQCNVLSSKNQEHPCRSLAEWRYMVISSLSPGLGDSTCIPSDSSEKQVPIDIASTEIKEYIQHAVNGHHKRYIYFFGSEIPC